jgi:outer membrane protein assembly factor BamB
MANTPSEVGRLSVQYPGGLAARYRWAGSGRADEVFAISESTGTLTDYGALGGEQYENLCRAELRVEGPGGSWTARLASVVFDEPQGVLWDTHGLLLVKYGFRLYALKSRSGELAWSYATGTPTLAVLASSRLDHVVLQTELETFALRADGAVAWRAAHNDVITDAQLIAGQLDLTTYSGQHLVLDARTGQAA